VYTDYLNKRHQPEALLQFAVRLNKNRRYRCTCLARDKFRPTLTVL